MSLVLTGCAVDEGSPEASTRHRDLGARAEDGDRAGKDKPRDRDRRSQKGASDTRRGDGPRSDGPSATGPTGGSGTAAGEGPGSEWSVVHRSTDPSSDQGAGPAYADLSALTVSEDGDHVRFDVALAGAVPAALAAGEVEGIGIDLYRSGGSESDYQVFLDGGRDGWWGYLDTPSGLVRFPGSVTREGQHLLVVVPWSALGGRAPADVSVFADWSSGGGSAGSDASPNGRLNVG